MIYRGREKRAGWRGKERNINCEMEKNSGAVKGRISEGGVRVRGEEEAKEEK